MYVIFCAWNKARSACYRGPKPQKCPKWLGEGAKGFFDELERCPPRVSCTNATLSCTSATLSWTSATGFWSSCTKTPFAPSPNHYGHSLSCSKLGEFCEILAEFTCTEVIGWAELAEFSPRSSLRTKKLTGVGVWTTPFSAPLRHVVVAPIW